MFDSLTSHALGYILPSKVTLRSYIEVEMKVPSMVPTSSPMTRQLLQARGLPASICCLKTALFSPALGAPLIGVALSGAI